MGKRFYMDKDGSEFVYDLEYWQQSAFDEGRPVVVEACKREKGGDGQRWCQINGELIYASDACGERNHCPDYDPCNGKNGRCRELKIAFIGTGNLYQITEKGSVRRK